MSTNLLPYILDPTSPIGHLPATKRKAVCESRTAYALEQADLWTGPNAPLLDMPDKVHQLMRDRCASNHVERLWVLPINAGTRACCEPIIVSQGNESSTEVCVRTIARAVLKAPRATRCIMVHNHPTNDPTPSPADLAVTRRVIPGLHQLDIPLLDHIVITNTGGYASIRRENPSIFV